MIPMSVLAVDAWNTEGGTNSFDCRVNPELYRYFVRQEPIPVLLLIDKDADWNQELENVYLVSRRSDGPVEHYVYELRPEP
jgi:hypothetical protein